MDTFELDWIGLDWDKNEGYREEVEEEEEIGKKRGQDKVCG